MNSKIIYSYILPKSKAYIETLYPLYDWSNIWNILAFKFTNIHDRPIVFKYIHEILPNNKRLYEIGIKTSPICTICNIEDSNIHRFYLYLYL